jgi:alpha-D-xyloside xylohydrolase
MKITRRALAKRLVETGTAAGLSHLLGAEAKATDIARESTEWERGHPGVWRATIGTPEDFTPVSSRLVEVQTSAFEKLPRVNVVPLPPIQGRRIAKGFMVQLPLRPGEQIYGLGLQMMSLAQRGKKKITRVNADPKMDVGDSHAPVPFYVVPRQNSIRPRN